MAELIVDHRIAQLRPDTNPQSVEPALGRHQPSVIQFSEPLSDRLLDAVAEALAAFPNVGLRAYGRTVDPSLEWLERFVHVRDLTLDLWHVTSFEMLASFRSLRHLSLGETASRRPSLGFLRELRELEVLRIEAHDRDFGVIGEVDSLLELYLRVPRAKSLDALIGHPRLEVVEMDFGGIRDLRPLARVPGLRGLQLYQVRKLDTDELAALGECRSLLALALGALRNVENLSALAQGPRKTLRYLTLERMTGLTTLADLGECEALEQIYLVESKPADGRLDLVARGKALRHLVVGDHYAKTQLEATDSAFGGETLWVRGTSLRGDPERGDVAVRWRRPVAHYLTLEARPSGG